jgi:hypothetical protein
MIRQSERSVFHLSYRALGNMRTIDNGRRDPDVGKSLMTDDHNGRRTEEPFNFT